MKTELDAAIGLVPPSPIDVDQLISRGRRRAMVRRFATAGTGGAAAAVAVGTAVALVGGAGGGSGGSTVAAPSKAASSAAAGPSAPALPRSTRSAPDPNERARAVELYLEQALPEAVRAHAPGVTVPSKAFDVKYMWRTDYANDSYFTEAVLQRPGKRGALAINVGARGRDWDPMNGCTPGAETGPCTQETEPDGTRVLRREINENGIRDYYVIVDRPDGMTLMLVAANQGGQLDPGPGHQPDPVLSVDELVALGHDATLTATPAR